MGSQNIRYRNSGNTITPPATPASPQQSTHGLKLPKCLIPPQIHPSEDSTPLQTRPQSSIYKPSEPRLTDPSTFPYQSVDYEFQCDGKGKRKKLGEGLWTDVYLAKPCLPKSTPYSSATVDAAGMTPPLTPIDSTDLEPEINELPIVPSRYAIKFPASTSAKRVLVTEAKILSFLSLLPDADHHIVPFFGLDIRTGSLVLEAMQGTLEGWIQSQLNSLDEAKRAQKLATVFPQIATQLTHSLLWMHDNGCTHADIKPSNILVSNFSAPSPRTLFSDFSSSVLATPNEDIEISPVGAGTWDYLDPSLLSSLTSTSPSPTTDLWSLAITLLFLVIGSSPYESFKANKYQQREMIRSGSPLQCLSYGDEGIKNIKRLKLLSKSLGFDVQQWFSRVLIKRTEDRVGISEWKKEVERNIS